MKEILEKFQKVFLKGLDKLENEKTDEAIQKFKEVSEIFPELLEKSEKNFTSENLEKFFESETGKETLKKYVSLYVDTNDMKTLKAEIEALTQNLTKLKEEKEKDDKIISKNLDKIFDTLEDLGGETVSKIED